MCKLNGWETASIGFEKGKTNEIKINLKSIKKCFCKIDLTEWMMI